MDWECDTYSSPLLTGEREREIAMKLQDHVPLFMEEQQFLSSCPSFSLLMTFNSRMREEDDVWFDTVHVLYTLDGLSLPVRDTTRQ